MRRHRALRASKFAVLGLLVVIALVVARLYTRPIPVSKTNPSADNADLRDQLLSAKKVLFVGAHPDDIEFYCGGLVYMMRRHGTDVIFAIGTRGGKGRTGRAKALLEGRRSHDQLNAAHILGGVRVVLYDYPDKALPEHVDEFADDLKALIAREKPDIVMSWDPDFIYNPHPDHQAAAEAARIATDAMVSKVCYYGTREPNLWIGYGEDAFQIKVRSLRAHRTETPWYYWPLGRRFLTKKSTGEGAKIGARYAEVYRCVDW